MKRTADVEDQINDRTVETAAYVGSARFPQDMQDAPQAARSRHEEDRISLFWRIFGGTLLSVAALVAVTVFNTINGSITELRAEISRLNEAKAESAKKDDLSALRAQVAAMTGFRGEIDGLKERATKARAEIDEGKRDAAARLELIQKEAAAVESLKEKVAAIAADAKAARDDLAKVRQDVDKNQAYDNERRDQRTAQMKLVDETLKELQKALSESREKIARLEGQQTPMKTVVPADAR